MKKIILFLICISIISSCKKPAEKGIKNVVKKEVRYPNNEYLSKGIVTICSTGKSAEFQTMLPVLKTGTYQYYKFYNISTKNHYAILGVMEILGIKDTDLTTYDSNVKRQYTKVFPYSVSLDDIESIGVGERGFSNLREGDTVTFICFHDDEFDENNLNDKILKFYQSNLPKIYEYPTEELYNTKEPKKGNGGILTVEGCN